MSADKWGKRALVNWWNLQKDRSFIVLTTNRVEASGAIEETEDMSSLFVYYFLFLDLIYLKMYYFVANNEK